MKITFVSYLLGFCILVLSYSTYAQKTYEYPLSNGFQASLTDAPALIQIPNDDGLSGEFVTREVPRTTCGKTGSATGYFFEDNAGLQFNNPEGFISETYSIAFTFQIDEFISPPSWVRILSFTHKDDVGIHLLLTKSPDYGTLELWPSGTVGKSNFFSPNEFYQMVIVRDAIGLIKIYVNGREFAEYDDSETRIYIPQDPDNYIIWFRDYPKLGSGEASPGFVSDIILANFPWTEDDVFQKWEDFCSDQ